MKNVSLIASVHSTLRVDRELTGLVTSMRPGGGEEVVEPAELVRITTSYSSRLRRIVASCVELIAMQYWITGDPRLGYTYAAAGRRAR